MCPKRTLPSDFVTLVSEILFLVEKLSFVLFVCFVLFVAFKENKNIVSWGNFGHGATSVKKSLRNHFGRINNV